MRQHPTERDRGPDQRVQFLIAPDGQLQMARCDAFDFEIFGCVAGQFEHFGSQVLEHGGYVDGG